jgi:ABC-type transport system involved in cytochrome bd biosynthesis fused ATPase/permease subunit
MGTVAAALLYPGGDDNSPSTKRLTNVLTQVGLGGLVNELNVVQNWSQRLSPGEQQRFAFARIFLLKPALLFLDESRHLLILAGWIRQAQVPERVLQRGDLGVGRKLRVATLLSVAHCLMAPDDCERRPQRNAPQFP